MSPAELIRTSTSADATYGTVLPSSLANIFLEPTDLFVDEEEDKEMDTQWFAMRSLMKD